jgi:hypothetical protein
MKFTALPKQTWPLALAAFFALAPAYALAQSPPPASPPPAAVESDEDEEDTAAAPEVKKDEDILKDVDIDKLDWSQLNIDASMLDLPSVKARAAAAKNADGNNVAWSTNAKGNGAAAVSVKQSVSPFWDTRIGADMTVVNPAMGTTNGDLLRQKYSPNAPPEQSSGSAWAAVTAPGVGSIWDKTAIEARVDPTSEQSKLGTTISKSVPLGDSYSLTLQNGYNVIQQGLVPVPGVPAHPSRNTETDQSAKLSIGDTGTSFTAGRTLSSTDDRWLGKVGAEQKLFDGVTISGSIGETSSGATNKSISAGFKKSW